MRIRQVGALSIVSFAVGLFISAPSIAADDSEVATVVAAITGQISAVSTAAAVVPDSGLQVAVAIGKIQQDINAAPGNPSAVVNLLGYCQPHLNQFIANTENLGALLSYGTCLQTGSTPAVLATLPQVTGGVQFVLGYCFISNRASASTSINFLGQTNCSMDGFTPIDPYLLPYRPTLTLTANASLVDYVTLQTLASANFIASGFNWMNSRGSLNNTISGASSSGIAKIKYVTQISPSSAGCASVSCGIVWVTVINKNPDSGTSLSCAQSGDTLSCTHNSIPLTDATIYRP